MKKIRKQFIFTSFILLLFSLLLFPAMSFLYGKTIGEIIRNSVISLFFSLGLFYFYHYSFHLNKLDYDNKEHPFRFFVAYMCGLILSILFPLVDKKGWLFLSIGVAIGLFSNAYLAFYSISGFIMFSVLLTQTADVITFFVYFLAAFLAILLFQDIDKSFKVGSSIFISIIMLAALEIAGFVMLENEELTAEQFIMPIVNIALSTLLLVFVLKYFNQVVANKYRNRYLEINDQEYKALIDLKEISAADYYRSIHTAYLAERMANAIGCNVLAAKNCAYYHRIRKAFSYSYEDCVNFVEINNFPPEASSLLLDYLDESKAILSKEAGIVYISDKFITTILSIFEKDKNIKIDYEALVNAMFEKDYIKVTLSDNDLSQRDFKTIKEIILRETLYYDFLR